MWFINGGQGAVVAAAIFPIGKPGEVASEVGSPKEPVSNIEIPSTKLEGKITEPKLPPKTVVKDGAVEVVHYTRSGDHGPPHVHVKGGGAETKVGQNGKPLEGQPELTKVQKAVIDANKADLRKAIKQIMKWFDYNKK